MALCDNEICREEVHCFLKLDFFSLVIQKFSLE